jgi:isopropylmalate/homocitrate/citramalate synthase
MTEAFSPYHTLTDRRWVADLNGADEVRGAFDLPRRVRVHDVTLREAEQAPHVTLRPEEKVRIYRALDAMGVDSVEIFPLVADDEKEVGRELVRLRRQEGAQAKVYFLCRWHEAEVDFAAECGADGVVIEGTANPWLGKVLLGGMTEDQMLHRYVAATAHARKCGLATAVMPWDTARAPLPWLERLYKSIVHDGGADRVVIADTHGSCLPEAAAALVRKLRGWVPGVPVEMHCHNDHGLATAIMLAAVQAGAEAVHTSINCLGERAGNAATEEVALNLVDLLGVEVGVHLDQLYPTAQLIAELTKIPLARNKPVVGDNQFTYESGMVIYSIEKVIADGTRPFGTYLPETIGRKGYDVVFGKMSGSDVITRLLARLGLQATREQTAEILRQVKDESAIRKWSIGPDVVEGIARQVLGAAR